MKRLLLLLLTVLTLSAKAQVYNNEWIDYSKTYYKFKVATTGLMRISQPVLSSIGLGATPAQHFQLWRNGQEVPIYTSVQTGTMGGSDYIEFWGEMNDGKPDNILYRLADYQLNDKWSLQTDTAAYFLTVNPLGNSLRLQPTVNNVAGNTLAPEPYFMYTIGRYYNSKINAGRSELVGDSYTYSSSYEYGEGWTSGDIAANTPGAPLSQYSLVYSWSGLRPYTGPGAPAPIVKVNAAGNAVHTRNIRVKLNGDSIYGSPLNYYDYIKINAPGTVAAIASGIIDIEMANTGTEANDRMVIGQVELTYAHSFDMGSVRSINFDLPANTAGNYLEVTGFIHSGPTPVLYDLTNGKRYVADVSNPVILKFALEPSSVTRKILVVDQAASNALNVTSFQQRNFVNYLLPANQGDFLIITHQALLNGSNGIQPVNDYKNYRSSSQGGSYNAKVYMIDELVDQFGLGIKKHPLSIRNFVRWARDNYSAPVKDVLLIGKGMTYNQYRTFENNPDVEKLALIPTFGYPASDNSLTAIAGSSIPLTPVGRLSVINGDELAVYLNKVKQYEQAQAASSPYIADKAWMKNVVHVTGASDDGTNAILETALNGHSTIITDTLFGGKVNTFTKSSADAVQQLSSARLTALMNSGIGLLTYFGHSSATTLEFNLDNPANYNNPSKYPVFIVMGCNAGNFYTFNTARFSTKETISERYVLAPERGSIAFFASTHLGIVHYLDLYNSKNYTAMSRSHYGKTLGETMDEAIRQVFNVTTENDFYARFQCEQFSLHGDPALKMYSFAKPDYAIEEPMVKVSPSFISIGDSSFKVNASFMNIGKSPADSIIVEVKRTYPGSTQPVVIQRNKIRGIQYIDSILYNIHIDPLRDKGLNKITITIDPENEVPELFETNNSVTKDIFIFEDEARPVYPYNLSIVGQQNTKFVVSSANAFAVSRDYIMEIDTTELFNSSFKVTRNITSSGGVFEFNPGVTFTDSTVYYWRVTPNVPTGPVWNKSSFIYLAGSDAGYNQSHLYQHLKSGMTRIKLDSTSRKWSFGDLMNNVFLRNGIYPQTSTQGAYYTGTINDVEGYINPGCMYDELIFNVIDPITFKGWKNQLVGGAGLYGSTRPDCGGGGREYNFQFPVGDSNSRHKAMNFINNIVPDGHLVLVRNNGSATSNVYPSVWKTDENYGWAGTSLYHALKNQGLDIDSFYYPRAFILAFKKNASSVFTPRSAFSHDEFDGILMDINCPSPDTVGFVTSPLFGPAKGWKQLKWRGTSADATAGDLPTVSVVGVNYAGVETTLFSGLSFSDQDYDLSSIDAKLYPYVKLKMRNQDSVNLSPWQLKYWRLTYVPVPEGAVAPNIYFTSKDVVEVGEPLSFGIAFKNVSTVDFDSVLVKFSITDKNNVEYPQTFRLKNLVPNDTIKFNIPINTSNIPGYNTVFVNFNPNNDQPEQHVFNNYAFKTLYVKPDSLQPVLDVTFDGMHILNRDIVSSKPDIVIKLKDEAKWQVLNDTSLLTLQVKYPNGTIKRFSFDNDTVKFTPPSAAPTNDNTASVNIKPYFPQDGDYELIVTGQDKSNNSAGNIEYRIGFQVINKPMISNMLNYPNPFTTSTAFVFTITGSEVPQNIRIQILTITGKIVREITKDELGTLRIGRNVTEFKWDGTDQYGQKLANGIYLYRVITNLNGKALDKYKHPDDETDKFFNKGYGKMYLMR